MLAAKFFDDQYFNNAYYAKVGGVKADEMNLLEIEFLFRVNFTLHVTPELYNNYHQELMNNAINSITGGGPPANAVLPPAPPNSGSNNNSNNNNNIQQQQ